MRIAVLALQGAFIEHEKMLASLGAECFEIRALSDLNRPFDGLVLPGGESTVQGRLLKDLGLFEPLKAKIEAGLPVLATCAGMILLSEKLSGDQTVWFGTLPCTVKRNAYGRQLASFHSEDEFKGLGRVPMTFIRAPAVQSVKPECQVLAVTRGIISAVRCENQLALAFHPELDGDPRVHRYFLGMVQKAQNGALKITS